MLAGGLSLFIWPAQLIRGGFDSIINLIFRLFFSKRRPAITLQDPNIKYALRLIDKQVTASTHDSHMSSQQQLRSRTAALPNFSALLVWDAVSVTCFRLSVMTPESSDLLCRPLNTSWASPSVSLNTHLSLMLIFNATLDTLCRSLFKNMVQ